MRWRRMAATAGPPALGGEGDALVGAVVDQAPVGQPLDQGGDRAGREAEPVREGARVGLGAVRVKR